MSAKHTPGPWSWVNTSWEYNHIYAARKLCATIHTDADVTEETADACAKVMNANARLIAAAPDLLEALKKLSFAAQTSGGTAGRDEALVAAIDHASAIIAKATGETK